MVLVFCCLVSCQQPGAKVVSSWKASLSAGVEVAEATLTFYEDNTYSYIATGKMGTYDMKSEIRGSYIGDASKDGKVTMTIDTYKVSGLPDEMMDLINSTDMKGQKQNAVITGNKLILDGAGDFTKQ